MNTFKEMETIYDERDMAETAPREVVSGGALEYAGIDEELKAMEHAGSKAGEAAVPDISFSLHGEEDNLGEEEYEIKTGYEETAEEEADTKKEQTMNAVNMLRGFNERAQTDIAGDERLSELHERIGEYVDMTGREAMIDKEFGSIDSKSVDRAAGMLAGVEKACDDYIEKARPFFRPGRRRRAAVKKLREEVDGLKDDRESLKKCYEDMYLGANGLFTDEETQKGRGEGDDGGDKKKNTDQDAVVLDDKQKAFVRGAGIIDASLMPVEFSEEGDVKQSDLSAYKDYEELTADKKADEVKLSEAARLQIYMVRAIGLIFGVSDWQQICDPEELLYREEDDSVSAVKIKLIPELMNKLSSKLSDEEGQRLADSFKGDTHMMKVISAILAEKSVMINELKNATGVNGKVLGSRMRSVRRYLAQAAKGER